MLPSLLLGLLALVVHLGSAAAEEPPSPPNLIGSPTQAFKPLTPSEQALSDAKLALAEEYVGLRQQGASAEELARVVDEAKALLNYEGEPAGVKRHDRAAHLDRGADSQKSLLFGLGKQLFVSTPVQLNSYYCGPASAVAVLDWEHGGTDSWDGDPLTQTNVGSSGWLDTDSGGTDFATSTWVHTLNEWDDNQPDGWYTLTSSPSSNSYETSLVFNIDTDHPVVLDVHMENGGDHLVGYPSNLEYWHYVVATGYGSYGTTTTYDDPYNGYPSTYGRHSGFSNSTVVSLVDDRGVILSLTRFPGHLDCGDLVAQGGVRDGYQVPTRVPEAGGGARAAA